MANYERSLKPIVLQALQDMPAVFINGPRQAGKSTLAKEIAEELGAHYFTFDDMGTYEAATHNPQGFIEQMEVPVVLDEVQMVPQLFRPLKRLIDDRRHQKISRKSNGQFLLTGSANVLALPALADALVGRMSVLTLYPLSMREAVKKNATSLEKLLSKKLVLSSMQFSSFDLDTALTRATFPQMVVQKQINTVQWFDSYLTMLLQRDVKALAEIEKLGSMPNMLRLFAARVGSLLNDASLARDCGLNIMTYRRYRTLLQNVFLIDNVLPWYRNINKRLVKAPKPYLIDTLLLCYLLGVSSEGLRKQNSILFGHILENFVATELLKQLSLMNDGALYHFRTQGGNEIDFVIEKRDGSLIAIEVKSRETITARDFSSIELLQKEIGKDFIRGFVLYPGKTVIPFGNDCYALPISALWEMS